jgi:membrane associated rhomboid family serine protease
MITGFTKSALLACGFVLLLWVIELLDRATGAGLFRLGVFPHHVQGLPGILFAPLIHGSWYHLLSNSFALLILLTTLDYGYPRSKWPALLLIWLGSGLGVWLFGRESYHFGASGLTHGVMFFIFTSGILRRDRLSIALSLIVFFIYGGMIWSIFPQEADVSYESHFFGAAFGVLGAFLLRHRDPDPPQKHYDWEDQVSAQADEHGPTDWQLRAARPRAGTPVSAERKTWSLCPGYC